MDQFRLFFVRDHPIAQISMDPEIVFTKESSTVRGYCKLRWVLIVWERALKWALMLVGRDSSNWTIDACRRGDMKIISLRRFITTDTNFQFDVLSSRSRLPWVRLSGPCENLVTTCLSGKDPYPTEWKNCTTVFVETYIVDFFADDDFLAKFGVCLICVGLIDNRILGNVFLVATCQGPKFRLVEVIIGVLADNCDCMHVIFISCHFDSNPYRLTQTFRARWANRIC